MTVPRAVLLASACLALALTCAPASADTEPSSAGLPARAAGAPLKVKVPTTPIEATPGTWVSLQVKVRNTARRPARRVAVRTSASEGVTLAAAKVRIGRLAPRRTKAVTVRVRIDTPAPAVVSISATSRRRTTTWKEVALRPTPPPPPGAESAWSGNFTGPTDEGIGFTLSADRTTITGWSGPRVYGSCSDQGSAFAWYPDTSIDSMPVDAAGNFVGTSSYVDSGGFDHTVRLSGTLSGTTVVAGSLTHTATWEHEGGSGSCTISDAQQTWTATQG